jgi:hypothetical protein
MTANDKAFSFVFNEYLLKVLLLLPFFFGSFFFVNIQKLLISTFEKNLKPHKRFMLWQGVRAMPSYNLMWFF